MRPIRVRVLNNNKKNIKTEVISDVPVPIGVSSERYIDYTTFNDGYVMVFDAARNCYCFVNPDDVLDNTYQQEQKPNTFTDTLFDNLKDKIDIDPGEY